MADRKAEIAALQKDWDTNPRWKALHVAIQLRT